MVRIAAWIVSVVLTVIAAIIGLAVGAVVVISVFFGWNAVKVPLAEAVSAATGRNFAINGDLKVDLGRVTRVEMNNVTVANADWAKPENMVELDKLDVSIDIVRLLTGDIVIPSLALDKPRVHLAKNKDDEANWQFGPPQPATQTRRQDFPIVSDIRIDDGVFAYDDAKSGNKIDLKLAHLEGGSDGEGVRVDAKGAYQNRPLTLKASAGALDTLRNEGEAYPVDIAVATGGFNAKVQGTVKEPHKLEGLDVTLGVKGDNLADVYALAGIPAPPSPPFSLTGRLGHEGTRWRFADFAGKLGGSDLRGTTAVDTVGGRLNVEADLASKLFDFKDLGVLIGGKRDEEKEAGKAADEAGGDERSTVLPNKPIDLSKLREMDAKVTFKATEVRAPGLPIQMLNAEMTLTKGVMRLKPATMKIADGDIRLYMTLDGSVQPAGVDIDARVSQVDLTQLMRGSGFAQQSAGTFGGRAKLSSAGNSVAEILGGASGELFLVMADGKISHLLVELAGLDIAQSIGVAIEGDQPIPVRCVVGNLVADNGVFNVKTLVFDTSDTKIVGDGSIDMRSEELNLKLTPYPKDFSLLSVRSPIDIQGTFKKPQAFPDPANTGIEGTVKKVINAVLTPIIGLLPPIDEGVGTNSACGPLIEQAREGTAKQPK